MSAENEYKPTVLVVDDDSRNLRLMEALLLPMGYRVLLAADGLEALNKVKEQRPDIVLLDVMMPRMDGFETARKLREDPDTSIIPIVMVTALKEVEDRVKALESGADDFLSKPVDKTELRARVRSLLKVKAYNDYMRNYQKKLEAEVARRTEQLRWAFDAVKRASLETIYVLSRAAEFRDEDTGTHIQRMSLYSAAVARKLGLNETTVENILYASPMHDIGKIGTPDYILLKPGKLDPDEWEIMKEHTVIGARILEGCDAQYMRLARVIAVTHHEKWDGSGYPKGLKGSDIPLVGQITAIADVFDALTSKRPYKEPFSVEKSFGIIREGRGNHFKPAVVDAFFDIEDEILEIRGNYEDEGESLLYSQAKRVRSYESLLANKNVSS